MDQHDSMLNLYINRLLSIQGTEGGEAFRDTSASHSDKRQHDQRYVIIPDIISPQHDNNNKIFIPHKD